MGNVILDDKDGGKSRRTEDKEIELSPLDIIMLILKYKWMILSITMIAALTPLIFNIIIVNLPSYQHPSVKSDYNYAKCTIIAKDETVELLTEIIQSVKLRNAIIENEDFMKIIGNRYWDTYNNEWLTKKVLTRDDIEATLINQRIINEKNKISIIQYNDDPKIAEQILKYYLLGLEQYSLKRVESTKTKRLMEKDDFIKGMMHEYYNSRDEILQKALSTFPNQNRLRGSKLSDYRLCLLSFFLYSSPS